MGITKTAVENLYGEPIDNHTYVRAAEYARKKLDWINRRAGRKYGQDGYGDDYLMMLTADTVREIKFAEITCLIGEFENENIC